MAILFPQIKNNLWHINGKLTRELIKMSLNCLL